MLSAAFNVNCMLWQSCPAGTELEQVTLDWLRELLGLPSGLWGIIYDTASSASMHAVAAAREQIADLRVREEGLAGRADVLIAPDLEAGNLLAKGITYFAQAYMAGIIVGARAPIILPSRSDTHEAKLLAIAMCVVFA